jgi:hypothetical protein
MTSPRGKRFALAALLLAANAVADSPAAQADHLGHFDYKVLRNGEHIGYNRVEAKPMTDGAGLEMTYDLVLEVTFGFLTVYSYSHRRSEIWRDGKLVQSEGHTIKNGKDYVIEVEAVDDGYLRTVNGKREKLAPDWAPLTFWNLNELKDRHAFFSVADDQLEDLNIALEEVARPNWWQGSGRLAHYAMTGDKEKDLWFDEHNHLVRVAFRNRGALIEFCLETAPLAAQRSP